MPETARPRWFEFDEFRLDMRVRVLWRGERIVPLPPKALDTLISLVRRGGEVVLKQDLMAEIWPDTSVEETGLAHNIWVLRKVLGPVGRSIKTVPKRGYRFTGRVRPLETAPPPHGDAAILDGPERDRATSTREPVPVVLAWCHSCERHVWMATLDEAIAATGTSLATAGEFVDRGTVHSTETAPGHVSLCMPSYIQALAANSRP